ncbi:ATP-dependent Clp protease proteolytic subunit [Brucella sp. MAB-22]|uniref:SDH family Clp fold serine proteinase n=1 Tax=unclassified Brucella TaxID=2632610 RepID=UPI0022211823|nr:MULTISPECIES: ATP-dependent Clp protease proteolytic subunit [unclassified Brucella]UYT57783.1 ATP-dependent Clp protease proteolytic subunit [Brucella sp. MAB-22]UZD70836.1 ATP-dependent Clp protease proteolytic subunit [Brucella sp. JSBI001]
MYFKKIRLEIELGIQERKDVYAAIEKKLETRVVTYVTGDRPSLETQISPDCFDIFVDVLDEIGPTKKISLILHTNGGSTSAAWRLVNLIKTFCDEFEVIVPNKAMSAGTLISLGANSIIMTKQAALGPIDPSLTHPLGPQFQAGNQLARIPVSVEAVRGYLDAAREDLKVTDATVLGGLLNNLSDKVHPLVLGEIFRSQAQIRYLGTKLLSGHIQDHDKVNEIVNFLCAESGSHDYTINRREAIDLGLNVVKPDSELYELLKALHKDYVAEMELLTPFNPLNTVPANGVFDYLFTRGLIESTLDANYAFVSEGQLRRDGNNNIGDQRNFEGWREQ